MKKITAILMLLTLYSCGWFIDTSEKQVDFTFILKNETGVSLEITGDFERRRQIIQNGDNFEVFYTVPFGVDLGLPNQFIEIKIANTNKGYRCHGGLDEIEGLCFTDDMRLFSSLEGSVFTEISPNIYQYTLTPNILEGVYELPELDF